MSGTVMRSTQFRSIVEPILNRVFDGVYDQRKDEYKAIFKEEPGMARSYHEEVELYGFAAAQLIPDGQAVEYDEGGELYSTRYQYNVFGTAFALTQILVEDGDHIRVGSSYAKHQAQSMDETLETITVNHLNRAFNASYKGGDLVSLCSASHPIVGGTQSNVLTSAALSQTSLEQGLITVRQAKDARNKPMRLEAQKIIVAPANMITAQVLLKSILRTGTNNNDVNVLKGSLDDVVMSRLSSSTAWFLQTNEREGLKVLWRRKVTRGTEGDFETDSMKYKATMRFGSGWSRWRNIYGNQGV